MIPEISKILYATDLSTNARYAFGYAASLANRYGAGIAILHVLEDLTSYKDSFLLSILGEEKWKGLVRDNQAKVIQDIRKRLEAFCEEAKSQYPSRPVVVDQILVEVGNPVEKILEQVEKGDPDLVVMGTHGQGILADAMMGSVSRRVLRRCKKPVLVIRLPNED